MTSIEKVLDRYTQAWNEGDPARRRELVAQLYAADAYYANQGNDFRGAVEVERALTRNYDGFLSKGFTFELADGAAEHHGSVRVPWRMLAPDGATVAAAGMQFLLLDDAGLVTSDYQFITQAPQG
jgi:nuclear transport factor 2 (NTF2) superfamily protein